MYLRHGLSKKESDRQRMLGREEWNYRTQVTDDLGRLREDRTRMFDDDRWDYRTATTREIDQNFTRKERLARQQQTERLQELRQYFQEQQADVAHGRSTEAASLAHERSVERSETSQERAARIRSELETEKTKQLAARVARAPANKEAWESLVADGLIDPSEKWHLGKALPTELTTWLDAMAQRDPLKRFIAGEVNAELAKQGGGDGTPAAPGAAPSGYIPELGGR
jgi:hypothetical protein